MNAERNTYSARVLHPIVRTYAFRAFAGCDPELREELHREWTAATE